MKKNKVAVIVCIIIVVLAFVGYFTLTYFLDKDIEEAEQDLQNTIETLGYVEQDNIQNVVAKFNSEIMDNDIEFTASEEYAVEKDEKYWYGMYEDISFFIVPVEYTGDKEKDIVDTTAIFVPKDSENTELAMKYFKCLVKANNNDLTDEEVDYLIEEAEAQIENGRRANNGKGLYVGISDGNDHYEYQVVRIYN